MLQFSERLRMLRKQRGITQAELGKILQYGCTAITNYESGRNQPSLQDVIKLADFFDVSTDFLLGYSDIPNPYVAERQILEVFSALCAYLHQQPHHAKQMKVWLAAQKKI